MEDIRSQWKRITKNLRSSFYRNSEGAIRMQCIRICQMVTDLAKEVDWSVSRTKNPGMTGNTRAGLAVGVYRDGKLIGYSTTAQTDNGEPLYFALKKNEVFPKGALRYDGSVQRVSWSPGKGGASREYMANIRAVNFLKRNKPSYSGFCYTIVHGAHYVEYNGFYDVMAKLYAEIRARRARITVIRSTK